MPIFLNYVANSMPRYPHILQAGNTSCSAKASSKLIVKATMKAKELNANQLSERFSRMIAAFKKPETCLLLTNQGL